MSNNLHFSGHSWNLPMPCIVAWSLVNSSWVIAPAIAHQHQVYLYFAIICNAPSFIRIGIERKRKLPKAIAEAVIKFWTSDCIVWEMYKHCLFWLRLVCFEEFLLNFSITWACSHFACPLRYIIPKYSNCDKCNQVGIIAIFDHKFYLGLFVPVPDVVY